MDSLLKVRGAVSPTDAPTPDDHRLLLGLLNQILSRIADYQGAGLLPGRADEQPWRWEDADYIYIESDHPEAQGQEADISVHDGKVFVRIAK
jgi:hypothetical protein